MTELWLKYTDENGDARRILVARDKFVIGRHSENDLSVAHSSLSRRHAQIERFGDIFVLSDLNSSNGITLNDAKMQEPVALKKDDRFNLGGGFEFAVELISDEDSDAGGDAAGAAAQRDSVEQAGIAAQVSEKDVVAASSAPAGGGSVSMSFFIIAPLLGVVVLLFVGGGIFLLSRGSEISRNQDNGEFIYSETPTRTPRANATESGGDGDETPTPTRTPSTGASETPSNSGAAEISPTPQNAGELDRIERNALLFARRIAINDNNYVFARNQLNEINNRVKNLKTSDALRDNLKAVKQNSAQFEQLAQSKGLKPQFLATAALARIGSQRGNPLQTAQSMISVLGDLKIKLGNELTDENLLIIAAYDQGERGDFFAMRNTVEVLSKQPGVDADKARTIWYLREKGKLSDAQYEFALRFLAIGAISQNPNDFNVGTEPVVFN